VTFNGKSALSVFSRPLSPSSQRALGNAPVLASAVFQPLRELKRRADEQGTKLQIISAFAEPSSRRSEKDFATLCPVHRRKVEH